MRNNSMHEEIFNTLTFDGKEAQMDTFWFKLFYKKTRELLLPTCSHDFCMPACVEAACLLYNDGHCNDVNVSNDQNCLQECWSVLRLYIFTRKLWCVSITFSRLEHLKAVWVIWLGWYVHISLHLKKEYVVAISDHANVIYFCVISSDHFCRMEIWKLLSCIVKKYLMREMHLAASTLL
jgi:hypothetical protein